MLIMEAGDKKKAEEKGNQSERPDLRLGRRQTRVASEENRTSDGQNLSSVLISKATPFETKGNELLPVLATSSRLHMNTEQCSSLGEAIVELLGNSGRKDPDPKPPFSKDRLLGAFSKSSVLGPERFQKAPNPC